MTTIPLAGLNGTADVVQAVHFAREHGLLNSVRGGFGYQPRSHGWTCDNRVSMEVVTAAPSVLRVG